MPEPHQHRHHPQDLKQTVPMDLTLAEALDDDEINELGRVEDSAQKKKIAKYNFVLQLPG